MSPGYSRSSGTATAPTLPGSRASGTRSTSRPTIKSGPTPRPTGCTRASLSPHKTGRSASLWTSSGRSRKIPGWQFNRIKNCPKHCQNSRPKGILKRTCPSPYYYFDILRALKEYIDRLKGFSYRLRFELLASEQTSVQIIFSDLNHIYKSLSEIWFESKFPNQKCPWSFQSWSQSPIMLCSFGPWNLLS